MRVWSLTGMLAAVCCLAFAVPAYAKETTIPDGVYAGDLNLGGLTGKEAESRIKAEFDDIAKRRIRLKADGTEVDISAGDLGVYWTNPEIIEEAEHAADGNLIRQYLKRKDIEKKPVHLELKMETDVQKIVGLLSEKCPELQVQPQNAGITRADGEFLITSEKVGKILDTDATKAKIDEALASGADEAEIMIRDQLPDITADMLSSIQDVLGTFSTDFSSSGVSRSGNLKNGASRINGHVLMPGETLSGYECMHPFTTENGYFTAAAYENGQVVDSVGGGVCQIATTLYNAALLAELEITQRQNHSMIVTYVRPSMDAAIAGTYKDIKITNNYSTPIYIEGGTSGRTLYFTIYGKETRPENRKIEYISETLSTTDPGAPTVRLDLSMAPGMRRQVQSAHIGRKSRLWKVVTVDGVETERTMLHEDTYNPAKAIILAGPEPVMLPQPEVQAETAENPAVQEPSAAAPAQSGPSTAISETEQLPDAEPQPPASLESAAGQ